MRLRPIIGQPGNSSIISRVKLGQTTVQLGKRAGFDDVGRHLGLTTGAQISVCKTPCLSTVSTMPLTGNGSGETTVVVDRTDSRKLNTLKTYLVAQQKPLKETNGPLTHSFATNYYMLLYVIH